MKKNGARILVVDDEREIVRLLQRTSIAHDFTEYALLKVLITNRDTILSRQVLLGQVWGQATGAPSITCTSTLCSCAARLKRIPADHVWIVSVPGAGYRFTSEVALFLLQ